MEITVIHLIPFISISIFLVGLVYKITKWNSTVVLHEQILFPAPKTKKQLLMQIIKESVFFKKIFNTDKKLWFGSWFFHFSLFLALTGHLIGITFEGKQFIFLGLTEKQSLAASHFLGKLAGILILVGLFILLVRRLFVLEVRKISTPADYIDLILLLGITFTGNYMRFIEPVDYIEAKSFIISVLTFSPLKTPNNLWFKLHFLLVMILLAYFPFSKLFHFIGGFFTQAITTKIDPDKNIEI